MKKINYFVDPNFGRFWYFIFKNYSKIINENYFQHIDSLRGTAIIIAFYHI